MTHQELRVLLEKYPKYPGTVHIPHSPIVHVGFPGNFNISFGEGPILAKFGNYLDNPEPYYFSTIQPCIRVNDLNVVMARDPTHLMLFDMADVAGLISSINTTASQKKEMSEHTIRSTFDFLINTLGLDPKRFIVSYFAGASIDEATKGKFAFDRQIEPDPFIHTASEFGIGEEQLVPDRSRTTLLSLNLTPPVCWGYRNEVLYRVDNLAEPLDIGSIENLLWQPILKDGVITSIEDSKNFWTFSVVGVERLLMLVNNLSKVFEVNSISPLVRNIGELTHGATEQDLRVCAEFVRVFHRITADIGDFSVLSESRREKLIPFRRYFLTKCQMLGIEYRKVLPNLLASNAKLQNYYPELGKDTEGQATTISNWLDLVKLR
jgi:hypothetical protein